MLPAQRGDALWLTYGERGGQTHHVLVDGGPQETIPTLVPELERRIRALPGETDRVELFVITHIDADHIQGAVSLLSDADRVPLFGDIWFNGWRHHQPEVLGGPDAERLTAALLQHPERWNAAFGGGAVAIPEEGPLPVVELPGGLRLTVVAPDRTALARLAPEWEEACRRAGIVPGEGAEIVRKKWIRDELLGGFEPDLLAESRFSADRGKPNGAGIVLIAEYGGKRVLLLGDNPAGPVLEALERLEPGPHQFDAVKMSHHGSRRNTSLEFGRQVQAKKWLVSTNGAQFGHPDPEAIARIVVTQRLKPVFYFNYATDRISDVVSAAGGRYHVKLPRRRRDGTHGEGIALSV